MSANSRRPRPASGYSSPSGGRHDYSDRGGDIGGALARDLVRAGERVVLAARDESQAEAVAKDLGDLATAASVRDAIAAGDVVVLAIWLDQSKELVPTIADLLAGKVVVDPSNPIGFDDDGKPVRTLPEGVSSGSVIAGLVPAGARYVKAFGTLGAQSLAAEADRAPRRVLFYATDDEVARAAAGRLILAAGFEPVEASGVEAAARLEVPGGDSTRTAG